MEALQRLHNRGSISTGYDIDNSVKLEADNTEYFSRTPSSETNRQTFTFSTWIKRTELGQNARLIDVYSNGQNFTTFGFDTNDRIVVYAIVGGVDYGGHYTQRLRDTSAWYHIVWKSDITNATAANRWQIYVNGVEVTGKDTDYGTPPTNFYTFINTTFSTKVGYNTDGSNGSSQYMAETHLVDGTALAPTAFGEYDSASGIWKPIEVDVTHGTNGFYLDYADAADLGDDESGNGNDYTETNITSADQATDTPTNNFATLNPIHATSYYTLKEGGTVLEPSQSGWGTGVSSIGVTSGKWYFEERSTATDRTTIYGVVNESDVLDLQGDKHVGDGVYSVGIYGNTGQVISNGSVIANYLIFNQNQLVACALDLDNGKVYFAIQNTWQNSANPANGTGGISLPTGGSDTYFFGVNGYFSDNDVKTNHGGYTIQTPDSAASDENGYGTFEFAPPSGYYALCTKNLAEYG